MAAIEAAKYAHVSFDAVPCHEVQAKEEKPKRVLNLVGYVKTRWSSQFAMLHRYYKLRESV